MENGTQPAHGRVRIKGKGLRPGGPCTLPISVCL
jgi:hypothetical protein